MVVGAHLGAGGQDVAKHGVQILEHIASGDTQDAETFSPQQRITGPIPAWLIAVSVTLAIDFNDEAPFKTSKIDSDWTDGKLPSELEPSWSLAQLLPEQDFGQAHLTPQLACALNLLDPRIEDAWAPSTMLRMVPLPVPGRIERIVELRTGHAISPRLAMRSEVIIAL
jgi:hypothetical protein